MKYIDVATATNDMAKLVAVDRGAVWVKPSDYEANLRVLVKRMQQSGAKLIWCSTTPVPEGANGRVPGSEVEYNAAALRVMREAGVAVNDLWAFVGNPEARLAMGGRAKDVHYTKDGSKALAAEVVKAIERACVP